MPPEEQQDNERSESLSRAKKNEARAFDKRALLLAALLLRSERKVRRDMQRIVGDASLALVGELRLTASLDSTFAETMELSAIEKRGKALRQSIFVSILGHRTSARSDVRGFLQREGFEQRSRASGLQSVAVRDRMRADAAASSIGDAWTRAHTAAIDDGSTKAIRDAQASLRPRVDLIATTENADVLSHEMRRSLEDAPGVALVWSAVLDKRTCDRCASLDGREVDDVYPPLHPRCRCMVVPNRFRFPLRK